VTYDEILARLESCRYDLGVEARLWRSGQKAKPEFAAVQQRFAALATDEAVQSVREAIERTADAPVRERMERALFALIECRVGEAAAPAEEELTAERARLSADVGGEKIPWHALPGRISREPDFEHRERLRAAQADLAERLAPLRIDREHAARQALAKFGFGSMRDYAETKKRVRHDRLLEKTLPILAETTGLYRRVMSDVIRSLYGRELGEIGAAHVLHWRAARDFDHLFKPEALLRACEEALRTIDLGLDRVPGIRLDLEDRPRKAPGGCIFAAKVPKEIHLVLRPEGGYDDMRAFMHHVGRALHLACAEADLPYEWRQLPRSEALSKTFGFALGHLAENPLWLEHGLRLPKAASERIASWALLGNLFMLRRTIARFSYELAFDEKPYDNARNKDLFAKTFRDLTGFRYEPAFWLEELDGECSAADDLRSWMASAQLEEHLVRKLGDRWFLKRDAGTYLKGLFAKGVSWDAEELVTSLGMTPWDPLPLIRKFDGVSRLLR
jgi:hypothetical protein